MVKTDCFAYRNDGCNAHCIALNGKDEANGKDESSLACRKGKTCFSYKNINAYEAELIRINGTTDMATIIAAYSAADPDKRRERWLAIVKQVKER